MDGILGGARPYMSLSEFVDHSGLMLANLTTFCQLLTSAATCAANSPGVLRNTSPPNSLTFAAIAASAKTALISLLSLFTIAEGVPLGAAIPFQLCTSSSG